MGKSIKKLDKSMIQLLILVIVALVVALGLIPFIFFSHLDVVLGWLLGSLIEIICFLTILKSSSSMAKVAKGGNAAVAGLSILWYFLRILLYAAGLVIGALCTFKSAEWFGGFDYFNFWAVFASYMPLPIVLLITGLIFNKKKTEKLRADDLSDNNE